MVPRVWIERTTYRLQGDCSTTELTGQGEGFLTSAAAVHLVSNVETISLFK